MTETGYLIVVAVMLLLSGLFSGSEIAFISANRLKVEVKRRQGKTGAGLASAMMSKPEVFLTTTLVGNNFVNVIYSTVMTLLLTSYFGITNLALQTILSTLVLLYVGEIIPKIIFRQLADWLVIRLVFFLKACYYLLFPLISLSRLGSLLVVRLAGVRQASFSQAFSVHDVEDILAEGRKTGTIDPDESELIENVFEMKQQRVGEIMIPRTDISALDIQTTMPECIDYFRESGYSRIPVFDGSVDNIVGIVHARDLFRSPASLGDIIRPVQYVPTFKKSSELLREFQQKGTSVAIVIDEYGGTAGLLTMEDLLEELVGDIQDEFDREDMILRSIGQGSFLVSGRVTVDDMNEKIEPAIEEGDYDTLAGFVVHHLGRIPAAREKVVVGPYTFDIIKATRNRIDLMKLHVRGTDEKES